MGYDTAMVNTSAPAVSAKDVGKKKKSTRTARLKQCKLDARREQWLSQVKNKCCKVSSENICASPSNTSPPIALTHGDKDEPQRNKLKVRPGEEENDGLEAFQDSDLESPVNSPTSSSLGSNYIRKCFLAKSGSSHCSSSSDTYSRSISEADEVEDERDSEENLDDWEAVADALMTSSDVAPAEPKSCTASIQTASSHALQSDFCDQGILNNPEPTSPVPMTWRPDDALRPRILPSLSKHRSFPMNKDQLIGHGTMHWVNEALLDQPLPCPICYEDLDNTDFSFLPCNCGFRLCLFCHKRILEADGRCPGCRKQYSPSVTWEDTINGGGASRMPRHLSRACSMVSRS